MVMYSRGKTNCLVSIVIISVLLQAIPSAAQTDRPVQIWPTNGWAISTPEEQGMNSTLLENVYGQVRNSGEHIRSLIVVRHGFIVAEEYFTPQLYGVNDTHILFSVTKSIVSCLIGIAIDKGFIDNTSQRLIDFFPDRTIANMSAWKEQITLENVLMMRSGFQWNEDNYNEYNDYFAMRASDDWAQYVLDRPMANEPGSTFYYNTGNSHLLATIINITTGMTPLAFADEYLFGPLGITRRAWIMDPQGVNFGGSSLALTPRDMAKFGLLYLNNGTWDEQQIVSSEWVSSSNHGLATPYTMTSYGYQWWIDDYHNWYSARGYNGQFIYVITEHDMVIVFTSDNENGPYEYDWFVSGGILDAITNIYPEETQNYPLYPWILGSIAALGIAAIVIIIRLRR